jgi:hypothetical protein
MAQSVIYLYSQERVGLLPIYIWGILKVISGRTMYSQVATVFLAGSSIVGLGSQRINIIF